VTAGRTVIGQSQDWGTPTAYVKAVRRVLGRVELDPCSNEHSVVRARVEYRLPEHDGLRESWDYPTIYVNPPYGADKVRGTRIRDWLVRCADAHRDHGSDVIALVPVATNTGHWKKNIWGVATSVAFLYDTRLKFTVDGVPSVRGAPMSCAMVYWGQRIDMFRKTFAEFGAVADLRSVLVPTLAPRLQRGLVERHVSPRRAQLPPRTGQVEAHPPGRLQRR
jgi:hypothetical protein